MAQFSVTAEPGIWICLVRREGNFTWRNILEAGVCSPHYSVVGGMWKTKCIQLIHSIRFRFLELAVRSVNIVQYRSRWSTSKTKRGSYGTELHRKQFLLWLICQVLLFQIFSDVACHRKILDAKVKCPNEACSWTGELRDVKVTIRPRLW